MKLKPVVLAAFVSVTLAAPMLHAEQAKDPRTVTEKTGDFAADAALTTKVKTALLKEKNLKSLPISVETTDGVVTLSGQLVSTAQIEQAVDVARHVKGVKDVHNGLELKGETRIN